MMSNYSYPLCAVLFLLSFTAFANSSSHFEAYLDGNGLFMSRDFPIFSTDGPTVGADGQLSPPEILGWHSLPLSIPTAATGTLDLTINPDNTISYTLQVDQAKLWRSSPAGPSKPGIVGLVHIHLGDSRSHGPIMFTIFDRTNGGPFNGQFSGTLTAEDLVSEDTFHGKDIPRLLAQYGVTRFEDAIDAIRNCNASVIVHTGAFWLGEIGGNICNANSRLLRRQQKFNWH